MGSATPCQAFGGLIDPAVLYGRSRRSLGVGGSPSAQSRDGSATLPCEASSRVLSVGHAMRKVAEASRLRGRDERLLVRSRRPAYARGYGEAGA